MRRAGRGAVQSAVTPVQSTARAGEESARHRQCARVDAPPAQGLLERFLAMQQQQQAEADTPSPVDSEGSAWWLDAHTQQLVERTLKLGGELTFTVREGAPMKLTREQVLRPPCHSPPACPSACLVRVSLRQPTRHLARSRCILIGTIRS